MRIASRVKPPGRPTNFECGVTDTGLSVPRLIFPAKKLISRANPSEITPEGRSEYDLRAFGSVNRLCYGREPGRAGLSRTHATRRTISRPSGDGVVDDTPALPLPVLREIGPAYRFAAAPLAVADVRCADHKVSAALRQAQ